MQPQSEPHRFARTLAYRTTLQKTTLSPDRYGPRDVRSPTVAPSRRLSNQSRYRATHNEHTSITWHVYSHSSPVWPLHWFWACCMDKPDSHALAAHVMDPGVNNVPEHDGCSPLGVYPLAQVSVHVAPSSRSAPSLHCALAIPCGTAGKSATTHWPRAPRSHNNSTKPA
jgi:hypothetical protein